MAQRTEKEETEFKVPETLTLCANNCGVTGNPATNNMCQKCFNATSSSSSSSFASSSTPTTSAVASGASSVLNFSGEKSTRSSSSRSPERTGSPIRKQAKASTQPAADSTARTEVNRCSGCRRKVGLTGFRCRCGELFCANHRYSDRHDCSYDYKAAGREAITRENPVVRASKIVRV